MSSWKWVEADAGQSSDLTSSTLATQLTRMAYEGHKQLARAIVSTPENLPEHVAKSILARATELDARSPMISVDELRAIAAEINVSTASLDTALREHQEVVPGSAPRPSRAALLVAALGLPFGAVAGSVLSTVPLFTAAPILSLVAGAGLLSSGALLILQGKHPSLRSYIGHNTALWGGVIAGSLSAIAILGSGAAIEYPWFVMIFFSGVKSWLSSTVLGSAAVIAMRRTQASQSGNTEIQLPGIGEGERRRLPTFLKRMLRWLNVSRHTQHYASAIHAVRLKLPVRAMGSSA